MPRVTEQHTAERRAQILAAARSCFVAKGLHAASMRDICTASGLSAGAVYHYFESKEAIALALAEELLGQQVEALGVLEQEADPIAALTSLTDAMLSNVAEFHRAGQTFGLRVQFLAEATHSEAYRRFVSEALETVMAGLAVALRRAQAAGRVSAAVDAKALAAALVALFQGLIVQLSVGVQTDVDQYADAVRALLSGLEIVLNNSEREEIQCH
jgi:AcrR family transcriptional regulator